jgi:outer membrane protein TolC
MVKLRNAITTEYRTAMSIYIASLEAYNMLRENVLLAQEVYDVVNLQYKGGIKTYLEVILAETDLRTARINYFNALYTVLSSKIDVLRSKGEIKY